MYLQFSLTLSLWKKWPLNLVEGEGSVSTDAFLRSCPPPPTPRTWNFQMSSPPSSSPFWKACFSETSVSALAAMEAGRPTFLFQHLPPEGSSVPFDVSRICHFSSGCVGEDHVGAVCLDGYVFLRVCNSFCSKWTELKQQCSLGKLVFFSLWGGLACTILLDV